MEEIEEMEEIKDIPVGEEEGEGEGELSIPEELGTNTQMLQQEAQEREQWQELDDGKRKEAGAEAELIGDLYPSLDDPQFNVKIAEKKEFADTKYQAPIQDLKIYSDKLANLGFEIAPQQAFVRNFLSAQTPYHSLLLYHGLGTGKTCSAIGVAEEYRSYCQQLGFPVKIFIIASPNVQDNFRLQLFDARQLKKVGGEWEMEGCVGNKLLKELNPTQHTGLTKEQIITGVNDIIKSNYIFMGETTFANRIQRYVNKPKLLQRYLNYSCIIIDEVHNITEVKENYIHAIGDQKEQKEKKLAKYLMHAVRICSGIRLLLLTATPMFNTFKEIIWLINLMNANDKRGLLRIGDIFTAGGDFQSPEARELFIAKITGYFSYVRGENPYLFPFRVYPNLFSPQHTNPHLPLPSRQLNGMPIPSEEKLSKLSLYFTPLPPIQQAGYLSSIHRIPKLSEKTKFGFIDLHLAIQSLLIVYPSSVFADADADAVGDGHTEDTQPAAATEVPKCPVGKEWVPEKKKCYVICAKGLVRSKETARCIKPKKGGAGTDDGDMEEGEEAQGGEGEQGGGSLPLNTGEAGLEKFMTQEKTNLSWGEFAYKNPHHRIFSQEHIGKYSAKIAETIKILQETKEGISLIFCRFIGGGILPMALALEEAGMTKWEGKHLFRDPPPKKHASLSGNYILLTGDIRISTNNKEEINVATQVSNKNGKDINVILISDAGSEGIDLKYIRNIIVLDPWYNLAKLEQIIGRGVRNKSHASLPFEQRNVSIYMMTGYNQGKQKSEETADLYVYRMAELEAITIGKLTRVLKQTSIDCILNHAQTQFTLENFKQVGKVRQILASGQVIDPFPVGDQPNTAICDYQATCEYQCMPSLPATDDPAFSMTYQEEYLTTNVNKIKSKIKALFQDKFFYTKKELVHRLNNPRELALANIDYALTDLIQHPDRILDKYQRESKITNIGEYYFIQPKELTQKATTMMERSMPIPFKHRAIRVDPLGAVASPIQKVSESQVWATVLENYRTILQTTQVQRGDTEYKYITIVLTIIQDKLHIPLTTLKKYLLEHLVDLLPASDIIHILNYALTNPKDEKLANIYAYYSKNMINGKALWLAIDNKTRILYVKKDNKWQLANEADKEQYHNHAIPRPPLATYYAFIAFDEKLKYKILKVKDTTNIKNKGARCDQADKKSILTTFNHLLSKEQYAEVIGNGKEKKIQWCILQEFIFRHYQSTRTSHTWFLTADQYLDTQ